MSLRTALSEGIILIQGKRLDREYIIKWLQEFAQIPETKNIIERFNQIFGKNNTVMKDSKAKRLKYLSKLFWDYEYESLINNLTSSFVIARVLELATSKELEIFVSIVGDGKIRRTSVL